MNPNKLKYTIRAVALSVLFSATGYLFVFLLTHLLDIELSKVLKGVINFLVTTIPALILFPKVFKIPFGRLTIREWLENVGIYFPKQFFRHIVLGILLGVISLSGLLAASLVTGKYEFSLSNLSPGHVIFSLTPGIWEEIFFRGVILIVLISLFKNLRKAFWWQVVIFALCHFKSADLAGIPEVVSVFIIGITFTLAAVKTRTLIAGIIYHFIHDAFLFLVQIPGGEYFGFEDQFTFYVFLWTAMLINIMVINIASDILNIKGNKRIYAIQGTDDNFALLQPGYNSFKTSRVEKIGFLLYALISFLQLVNNIHNGISLVNILSLLYIILNLLFFVLSFKRVNALFYLVFFFNGIYSFVSGYNANQAGSEKAYIFYYLTGVIYLILTFYFLSIYKQKRITETV